MTPNIDAIIAELSEAQSDWVIHLGSDKFRYSGVYAFAIPVSVRQTLRQRGLTRCEAQPGAYGPFERLTPLGLAVRSALIGEVGRDG
jgi:hypothetical protein